MPVSRRWIGDGASGVAIVVIAGCDIGAKPPWVFRETLCVLSGNPFVVITELCARLETIPVTVAAREMGTREARSIPLEPMP